MHNAPSHYLNSRVKNEAQQKSMHSRIFVLTIRTIGLYILTTHPSYTRVNHLHASPEILKLIFIMLINVKMPTMVGQQNANNNRSWETSYANSKEADRSAHLRSQTSVCYSLSVKNSLIVPLFLFSKLHSGSYMSAHMFY